MQETELGCFSLSVISHLSYGVHLRSFFKLPALSNKGAFDVDNPNLESVWVGVSVQKI